MRWIQEHWAFFSTLVLALGAGWIIFTPPSQATTVTGGRIPAPREGFLAPDFSLQNIQGNTARLSDLRGKPLLINFWASWCPPCQAEMADIQKVYSIYTPQGLTVLGINTTYQDDRTAAISFAAGKSLTFPILFDLDGTVARKYEVLAMPTSFFVDKDGIIRRVVIGGPMPEGLLRAEIERLIQEGR